MAALRGGWEDAARPKPGVLKGIKGSYQIAGKLGDRHDI